jgi:uncharacterized membrane protein
MAALFGTALLTCGLGVSALEHLAQAIDRLRLVGGLLYLATILITLGYHIPRNNALARVSPTSTGACALWRQYAASWTLWNHLRASTAIAGAISLVLSLSTR